MCISIYTESYRRDISGGLPVYFVRDNAEKYLASLLNLPATAKDRDVAINDVRVFLDEIKETV